MSALLIAGLGLTAGFHGALYGAWKDSPYESFRPARFMREIVIALGVALALGLSATIAHPLVLVLGTFAVGAGYGLGIGFLVDAAKHGNHIVYQAEGRQARASQPPSGRPIASVSFRF